MAEQVYDNEPGEDKPIRGPRSAYRSYKGFRAKQKADRTTDKETADKLGGFWRESKDDEEINAGLASRLAGRRLAGGIMRHRRLVGMGVVGAIMTAMFAFSGLFSMFKMNHIMDNIDQSAFSRLSASIDTRNTSYLRSYMELRLLDICPSATSCAQIHPDTDNFIFRGTDVERSKNPIYNWYRTVRSSAFEQDVFNNNGVFITSGVYRDGNQIRTRTVKFAIKGDTVELPGDIQNTITRALSKNATQADILKLNDLYSNGTLDQFFDKQILSANSERRAAIKSMVSDNTQWWNIFKRRQMRKDIADKTGTPKWRFFDDTRTKIDAKKVKIRNQIIDAITPDGTKTGKFINCLFGISDCTFSPDPESPANLDTAPADVKTGESVTDPKNSNVSETLDFTAASDAVKKAIAVFGDAISAGNWTSIINSLVKVDNNIRNHSLSAQVATARGIQAMALYQTFSTVRDQLQTGNANSDEVSQFMSEIGSFTSSEAWVKAVDGKGNPSTTDQASGNTAAKKYCKAGNRLNQNNSQFAYLCNDTVIGSTATGASELENAYNDGPGVVLHPILSAYCKIFCWIGNAFNTIFSATIGPIISGILDSIPGLAHTMQNAVGWAVGKLAIMLGAGPMYSYANGDLVPAGQLANGVVQGAAYTAESSARQSGAAATNPVSQKLAQSNTVISLQDQKFSQSFIAKYLSPSNPKSPVSNSLFALSQIKLSSFGNIFGNLTSFIEKIPTSLISIISGKASAATNFTGYEAADVAQIQTYDFPSKCYSRDPLTETPANGTNVQKIFGSAVKTSDLTWDLVTNNISWYAYLYQLPDANTQMPGAATGITRAMEVYNCNLLDNSVMGGLGYLYGYSSDNGYSDTSSTASGSGSVSNNNSQQLAQQILQENKAGQLQLTGRDVLQDIQAAANNQPGTAGVNTSSAILQLIANAGKNGNSAIITAIQSGGSGHCGGVPKSQCPTDPHYNGDAVDFGSFDGHILTGRDKYSDKLINLATSILPSGSGFGQKQCGPSANLPNGFTEFNDTCNHLHVQVPVGTP